MVTQMARLSMGGGGSASLALTNASHWRNHRMEMAYTTDGWGPSWGRGRGGEMRWSC